MKYKLFTIPRLIFIITFTYINTNISQYFAYNNSRPAFFDYITGFCWTTLLLYIGLIIGLYSVKKYGDDFKPEIAEIFGIIISIMLLLIDAAIIITKHI
jgi:hypothetical protein